MMLIAMLSRSQLSLEPAALGIRSIGVGALLRVQCAEGDIWSANVTYVSGQLIGMRGWTPVDGRCRERDAVTLLIGHGDRMISANAQVLAASGPLLRVVRRDAADGIDRRRAPRLRVDLAASVTLLAESANSAAFEAEVVDLSASGCAVRSPTPLAVGAQIGIAMDLNGVRAELCGDVMRTWTGDAPLFAHAGIKFHLISVDATMLVQRFLINQLQFGLATRRPC